MKKKLSTLVLAAAMLLSLTACGQSKDPQTAQPNVSQMLTICELATMECYYHNVAKYYEADATDGLLGLGKKDKHFWIEYSGVVKLGVDVSQVEIQVEDDLVSIVLPPAEVLDCTVDSASLTADSFIVDKKSADIEAADEVKAFQQAQAKMEENAKADKALLANAQQRAKDLLEAYLTNLGQALGREYTIQWQDSVAPEGE